MKFKPIIFLSLMLSINASANTFNSREPSPDDAVSTAPVFTGGLVQKVVLSNTIAHVTYKTMPGFSYQLQKKSNIANPWWQDVGTTVSPTAMTSIASVPTDGNCTFFRVLEFTNSVFWYDWDYRYQSDFLQTWGLGTTQTSYWHQDRCYEWYIDQANTGAASGNNCGPSSATMAVKWFDASFTGTAEDARNWSYDWRQNGWWYTDDIYNYLNLHAVSAAYSAFTGGAQMEGLISDGKILILCIDTTYLPKNLINAQRSERFYNYTGGHFIVVKGARSISGTRWFEVYDPNNWNKTYSDGTQKGKNRHFSESSLTAAIQNWWNYMIVVSPPAEAGGGGGLAAARLESDWIVPVDASAIKHANGM